MYFSDQKIDYKTNRKDENVISTFFSEQNVKNNVLQYSNASKVSNVWRFVTQRQLMKLLVVSLILSYEQKCKVRSKFLKN